jgi:hypothetical protein
MINHKLNIVEIMMGSKQIKQAGHNHLNNAIAEMLMSDTDAYKQDIEKLVAIGLEHANDETKLYWSLWFSGLESGVIEKAESAIRNN